VVFSTKESRLRVGAGSMDRLALNFSRRISLASGGNERQFPLNIGVKFVDIYRYSLAIPIRSTALQ
jgi:hypothetical protein